MDARCAGHGGSWVSSYGVGGGGGGGCGLYDISMVDRMMLKFRPIAPKPMASSGSGSGDLTAPENGGQTGRSKRRYVKVKKGNNNNNNNNNKRNKDDKKRKLSTSSFHHQPVSGGGDTVVTLSLLPETPDPKKESPAPAVVCSSSQNFNISKIARDGHVPVGVGPRRQTVSFVTVECVTDTWVDGEGIGWNEEQGVKDLEGDTCPGFISDGGDKVVWMNKAYREMAGGDEVVVVLVRKKAAPPAPVIYPAAFTCSVKVTCRNGMPSSTLAVPCDTWRVGGGYAWRLDVKAALCLGR